MATIINTHITFFPGLPNLNLPLPSTTPFSALYSHLPHSSLYLTTTSGRHVPRTSSQPISALTPTSLLTLRCAAPLCGGKGGFGSQLRAAGGRMSSRKKSQENSDSCRNLDGRRLRTVKEAKALAEYLEIKPEMEKKEREARMQRWRDVIAATEKREEGQEKKRFDDVEWLERVEEGRERMREAVAEALKGEAGGSADAGEGSSAESEGASSEEEKEVRRVERRFIGWDDDDEFMSSDDEGMEDIQEEEEPEEEVEGKGKGKVKMQG